MKNRILLILLIPVVLSSCTAVKTFTAKSLDIYGAGVIQKPVIADLSIKDTKVSGFATGTVVENVKNMAVANAINKANIDVLVEPKYEIMTTSGNTSVTVTGFPGIYRNFRPMVAQDTTLLKMGYVKVVQTDDASKQSVKKKSPLLKITGVALGAVLVVLIVSLITG